MVTFERRVAEGTPQALEQAAELYRGDLLLGFSVERAALRGVARRRAGAAAGDGAGGPGAAAGPSDQDRGHGARDPDGGAAARARSLAGGRAPHAHAALRPPGAAGGGAQAIPGVRGRAAAGAGDRAGGGDEEALPGTASAPGRGGEGVRTLAQAIALAPRARSGRRHPISPRRRRRSSGGRRNSGGCEQLLDEAIRGHGHVATVVGEAGIGKTRLVSTLAADALSRGCRVLIGRCHESDSILPFGPWVDACRSGEVSADEEILGALHPTRRAELTRLLPEAGMAGLPPASDSALPLFESVAELIEQVAARQPLVLVLEDLHWADEMSLRLLAFVSRRIPAWTALLVVTAREEELADASMARRTVEELSRSAPGHAGRALTPVTTRHRAARASAHPGRERRSDGGAGGGADLGDERGQSLRRRGGDARPRSGQPGGRRSRRSPTRWPCPRSVRDLVARRLDRLSARTSAGGRRGRGHRAPVRLHAPPIRQRGGRARRGGGGRGDGPPPRAPGRGEPAGLHPRSGPRGRVWPAARAPPTASPSRRGRGARGGGRGDRRRDRMRSTGIASTSRSSSSPITRVRGELREKAVHYLRQAGTKAAARSALPDARAWFEQALDALEALPESQVHAGGGLRDPPRAAIGADPAR